VDVFEEEIEMGTTAASPSFLGTRRAKLTLALLCAIAFLDFVDASIVNLALPSIRRALHFSVAGLLWVPGGYLLTYGGFMLLGGRAADLLGRRRVLLAGIVTIGVSSLVGGMAQSSGVLVAARLAQGVGAALTLPAALSIQTTSFKEGKDRHTALGVWGGVGGLASAVGVLLGGLLTQGPGWRWVMFVNPIACLLVVGPVIRLIAADRGAARRWGFDVPGAVLVTGGMLLLVYTLVKAPTVGLGSARTIAELAGAVVLLVAFVVNERRHPNPLAPMSIFKINGLGYANLTQLIAFAGFLALFFFLTLYMQNVLHYSPIQAGAAYLPLCLAIGISAGISSQLLSRVGTRRYGFAAGPRSSRPAAASACRSACRVARRNRVALPFGRVKRSASCARIRSGNRSCSARTTRPRPRRRWPRGAARARPSAVGCASASRSGSASRTGSARRCGRKGLVSMLRALSGSPLFLRGHRAGTGPDRAWFHPRLAGAPTLHLGGASAGLVAADGRRGAPQVNPPAGGCSGLASGPERTDGAELLKNPYGRADPARPCPLPVPGAPPRYTNMRCCGQPRTTIGPRWRSCCAATSL
jgi:MFS family permease